MPPPPRKLTLTDRYQPMTAAEKQTLAGWDALTKAENEKQQSEGVPSRSTQKATGTLVREQGTREKPLASSSLQDSPTRVNKGARKSYGACYGCGERATFYCPSRKGPFCGTWCPGPRSESPKTRESRGPHGSARHSSTNSPTVKGGRQEQASRGSFDKHEVSEQAQRGRTTEAPSRKRSPPRGGQRERRSRSRSPTTSKRTRGGSWGSEKTSSTHGSRGAGSDDRPPTRLVKYQPPSSRPPREVNTSERHRTSSSYDAMNPPRKPSPPKSSVQPATICERPECRKPVTGCGIRCPLCGVRYDCDECYVQDVHRHLATCPAVKWRAISSTKTEERASDEDSSREGKRGQRDLLSTISPTTNNASTAKGKTEGTDKGVCGSTKHIGGTNNSHTDTLSREVIGPAGSDDSDAEFGMSDLSLVSDEASVSDDDGESVHITTIREQSSTGDEIRGPPSASSERHWMWEYLPTKFRTGKYAMSSTLLAFMEKRVSKGTSYGHKKAFLQYVEFLKTEKVLAPGLDVSPFLLEPLKKEEKSVLMRRFIIFVAGVLGKKEEMMTAFLGQLRSNWVVAGIKTSFLAFTKDEAKEIKKSAKRSRAEEKARLDRQAHNEKEALRMYMLALLRDKFNTFLFFHWLIYFSIAPPKRVRRIRQKMT